MLNFCVANTAAVLAVIIHMMFMAPSLHDCFSSHRLVRTKVPLSSTNNLRRFSQFKSSLSLSNRPRTSLVAKAGASEDLSKEAETLLARAKEIRDSLPKQQDIAEQVQSSGELELLDEKKEGHSVAYRLYVDIGREPGTWMDPRWGASGNRIEFTVDVFFMSKDGGESAYANDKVAGRMVKDNFRGKSSPTFVLNSSAFARLRGGFDKMASLGGGYRIDNGAGGSDTVRFYLMVDGTPKAGSTYGDVSIPQGCLYFSVPCFGYSIRNLSLKEGPVTVRQIGWHTGWRREESRIVGTFRAVPLEDAKRRDKF